MFCVYPFSKMEYNYDIPMLEANFVTTEQGTGIVHCAPSHGPDDFNLCLNNNIKAIDIVIDQIIPCKQSCQNNKWEKSIFNWEFLRKLWWLRSHSRYTLKVFKNQDNKGFFS